MINEWYPWLDSQKLAKINSYKAELLKFNDSINLISPNTIKGFDNVHLADCIAAATFVLERVSAEPLYDLGSGNGLPGIVMAILNPDRKIILVDRDIKKVEFMKHVINDLKLENASCLVKNLGQESIQFTSQAISRAMAPMGRMLKTIKDSITKGNKIFLMKTPKWESELATDHSHLEKNWSWSIVHEYSLPQDNQKRVIIEAVKS